MKFKNLDTVTIKVFKPQFFWFCVWLFLAIYGAIDLAWFIIRKTLNFIGWTI